ncbi:hypothetical protein D3C87_2110990 [compost metagenome]
MIVCLNLISRRRFWTVACFDNLVLQAALSGYHALLLLVFFQKLLTFLTHHRSLFFHHLGEVTLYKHIGLIR